MISFSSSSDSPASSALAHFKSNAFSAISNACSQFLAISKPGNTSVPDVSTMLVLFFNGLPKLSIVFLPIIKAFPFVCLINQEKSSGKCHNNALPAPNSRFSPTAAIIEISISQIYNPQRVVVSLRVHEQNCSHSRSSQRRQEYPF